MKQTPLSQLIDQLEERIQRDSLVNTAILHYGLRQALDLAKKLKLEERTQIESAYDSGKYYPYNDSDGSKYYFMNYITND